MHFPVPYRDMKYDKSVLVDGDIPWPSTPAPLSAQDLLEELGDSPVRFEHAQRLFHRVNVDRGCAYRVQVKKGTPGAVIDNRRWYVRKHGPVAVGPRALLGQTPVLYIAGLYRLVGHRSKDGVIWYPCGQVAGIDPFALSEWDEIAPRAVRLAELGRLT